MKMKIIALFTAAVISFALFASCSKPPKYTLTPGWQMMEKMGIGINIGNTLEATADAGVHQGLESETFWGAEKIEEWQFQAIKAKGIDTVRLPVTWGNHMDPVTRRIDEEWMERVQQCVDWALKAGLTVILNTHHEHELYSFMNCDNGMSGDFDAAAKWLDDVWGQIAERFKYYQLTLVFEPMNEPKPGGDGPGWYWDHVGQRAQRERLCELVNRLNRHVLETIRKTGGNNDKRIVINAITQADAKLIDKYEHTFDDPNTMLGVFFYTGGEQLQFDQIKKALEEGIPIVLKETLPIEIEDKEKAETWAKTWYNQLAPLGAAPVWWNCYGNPPGDFFSRLTGQWTDPMVEIVFAAYKKTPGPTMERDLDAYFAQLFSDSGYDNEGGFYWYGGFKLRDAMIENKYLIVELDTDDVTFVIHSGANGYTRDEVQGNRVAGTNWWYIETAEPISHHSEEPENMGWWIQIQLPCDLKTDKGVPKARVSNELPVN